MDLIDYDDVRAETEDQRRNLLLGNGFSIACNGSMAYSSLHEWAVDNDCLSEELIELFETFNTHNFEYVMARLNEAAEICRRYGLDDEQLMDDVDETKSALAAAIIELHLASPFQLTLGKRRACADFLRENHSVFTTNYDLQLYWIVNDQQIHNALPDGFADPVGSEEPRERAFSTTAWRGTSLWFLHGALHLYEYRGAAAKRVNRGPGNRLLSQVRHAVENQDFPLVVTEGTAQEKLTRIQSNLYLQTALAALSTIEGPLIVYGSRLAECDQHILDTIVENLQIPALYISVRGDIDEPGNLKLEARMRYARRRRRELAHGASLDVNYYDSDTADVWG